MNNTYKSVRNQSTGTVVAVGENSKSRGKSSTSKVVNKLASASLALGASIAILSAGDAVADDGVPTVGYSEFVPDTGVSSDAASDTVLTQQASDDATSGTDGASGKKLFGSQMLGAQMLGAAPTGASVLYDDSTNNSISFVGTTGTKLSNVAAGAISATSMDAVNGSQLFGITNGSSVVNSAYVKVNGANNGSDNASVTSLQCIAIGAGASANTGGYGGSIAIGNNATVANINQFGGMAIGTGAYGGGTAIGFSASASATRTVALGRDANASKSYATALGASSTASSDSSVALGQGSVANRGSAVSVGSAGAERQITNVAAATQGTDAVNYAQLQAAGLMVDTNGQTINAFVAYDNTTKGTLTLAGGSAGTAIKNVAAGDVSSAQSTDAVNGSQLYTTNQNVATNTANIATNTTDIASSKVDIATNASDIAASNAAIAQITADTTTNTSDIATNSAHIATNTSDIVLNTANIATNTTDIAANAANIATNTTDIASSKVDIATNASDIAASNAAIAQITADTTTNTSDIATNSAHIATNTSDIASNTANIATNTTDIAANAANIATNTTDIAASKVDIATNASGIAAANAAIAQITVDATTNTSDIAKNAANIAANTSDIAKNAANITANTTDIATSKVDIATNTTDIASSKVNIAQNTGDISTLNTQMADAVKYDTSGHSAITLGGGAAGTTITNLRDGQVSASSKDAVNGSQLFTVQQSIAAQGTAAADSVQYDSAAHDKITFGTADAPVTLSNVKDGDISASSLDAVNGSQLYTVKQDVMRNTSDIASLNSSMSDLSTGALGLVRQDAVTDALSIGAGTNGNSISFAGLQGSRILTGVANGAVNQGSSDAINGSQMFNASSKVASALGGGASVDSNGGVTAPSYTVGGKQVNDVGSAIGNLDGRVTQNSADIAGMKGDLATVANTAANAVAYDSADHSKITLGGANAATAAVQLTNVAAGDVSASSRDAVNGAQLSATNDRVTSTETAIANFQASGMAGSTASGQDSAAIGANAKASGDNSTAAGSNATAAGKDSTAAGGNATASGDNSTAAGANANASGSGATATGGSATASGNNSTANGSNSMASGESAVAFGGNASATGSNAAAIGGNSQASGNNSVAFGGNSQASGDNSVALGANSVANEANTVSVGSAGNERRVTNVAPGVNGTDAANVNQVNALRNDMGSSFRSLQRSAYGGIAAAMAMPNATPSARGKTVVGAGVANFKGYTALGAGVTYRSDSGRWIVNGAVSVAPSGDSGVRAHADYEF